MKAMLLLLLAAASLCACKRNWSDKDKAAFMGGCTDRSIRALRMGEDSAKAYCRCLLDKVVARYPNANDASYIRYDTSVQQLSRDCLQQRR